MAPKADSPPTTPSPFSQPQPRPARSAEESAQVRIQNRRRAYLERNPDYVKSNEHELADPILYDSLIRRFQSTAEREAEGRAKGYGRALEGSLRRGEVLERIAESYVGGQPDSSGSRQQSTSAAEAREQYSIETEPPEDPVEGRQRWEDFVRERFVRGEDEDFDYAAVDNDESYDTLERADEEDRWFDEEEPRWAEEDDEKVDRPLNGETGVQDF